MIGGNPLETADGHRALIGAATPAGGFAGAVTDTAKYAGENITFPVLDIGLGEITLGDFANVLGYIRMRRTGPLAIHYLVVIIRVINIRGLHF